MNATSLDPALLPAQADARIDWTMGRIVGYSVAPGEAFDVVQLLLNGDKVASVVANLSTFAMAAGLAGMTIPPRELSVFELRIPQGALLPGHLGGVWLEVRTGRGETILSQQVKATHELLHLTEGVPAGLLFEVAFRGFRSGAIHGVVRDRHEAGVRPALQWRFNDGPATPLTLTEPSTDGNLHHFAVPLQPALLAEGENVLHILAADGLPLAAYPLQVGVAAALDTNQRVAALEAEVEFLKHLVLTRNSDAITTRLALLKSEIVGICSDMLALQRSTLEREFRVDRPAPGAAAPSSAPAPAAGAAKAKR